ncbi:MAG TPA: hypothetical protein VMU76_11210 [Acidimicrobiales bacterium]|nr:hypothetical protein [Acidimicrobiales bacterium]
MPVASLKPGDRVRHRSGTELTVSRIDSGFLGREGMSALIEDTSERWLKAPVPDDGEIELWSEG